MAFACAVCGAGDRTLPANGNELAFAGRLRATLDARAAAFAAREEPLRVTEVRTEPGASVALGADTLASAIVPVLRRTIATESDGSDRVSLGDVEARVSHLAWSTGPSAVGRRLTAHVLVKAPTAPLERDPSGRFVPTDLQPGCGSIVPGVGLVYTWTFSGAPLLSIWTSATLLLPVSVRDGPHPGDSLRGSTTFQLQPATWIAARASAHARWDGAGDREGVVDRASGGAAVYAAPEIVLSPATDLVVTAGASIPVVQEMRGYRVTAPIAMLGLGLDL